MARTEAPRNWDIPTAAERIGVSPHPLRTWLRQRRLPYIRAGRRILLVPEDVERFLRTHTLAASVRAPHAEGTATYTTSAVAAGLVVPRQTSWHTIVTEASAEVLRGDDDGVTGE